jgi:serine/threonine-protein kinase RsbW
MREQQKQFTATLNNLEAIAAFISECMEGAALSEEQCYNFEVAVDEHISNLIEHAFANDPGQSVTIVCRDNDLQAQVSIIDCSAGFDPRKYSVPNVEEHAIYELPPGGFGNYFICELMDKVEYIHKPYVGNELILTVYKKKKDDSES